MRRFIVVVVLACMPAAFLKARAVTVRYAIVIGNNDGLDFEGHQPFPRLQHAESEARRLRDSLIELANFDPSPDRTVLLTGATRDQVERAVRRLTAQMAADRRKLGEVDSLFAFFFTGHGLSGRLLLHDGPLTADEVGTVFKTIAADFNIGVFDACYSGSLDQEALSDKGVELTPGLNIFRALPEEVLTAEGSIWFVSSGPNQLSYEDRRLGGVFTHFFIEALRSAPVDGPGITLDNIWAYVRKHTVAHTTRHGRRQVPQQYVAKLKSTGPLYFSFPVERTARLTLTGSVEGHFVLTYAEGQLTESIDKRRGEHRELAVYPGRAHLTQLRDGKVHVREEIHFQDGGRVTLRANPDPSPVDRPGRANHRLWEKGAGEQRLTATAEVPRATFLVGMSYAATWAPSGTLSPGHTVGLALRFDLGSFTSGVGLGYGRGAESFTSWSYGLDALVGEIHAGAGWDLGPLRLSVAGSLSGGRIWQEYDNLASRTAWFFCPAVRLGLMLPTRTGLAVELTLNAGAAHLAGAGQAAGYVWQLRGGLGLAVYYQL